MRHEDERNPFWRLCGWLAEKSMGMDSLKFGVLLSAFTVVGTALFVIAGCFIGKAIGDWLSVVLPVQ